MKVIFFLFICLLYLIKLNNALPMKPGQLGPAQTIISDLFSDSNYADPCTYSTTIFTCVNDGTGYNTVTEISTGDLLSPKNLNTAFSSFPDLTSITIGKNIFPSTTSWANFNQLSKLTYLEVQSVKYAFPSGFSLPSSNLDITFYLISVPFLDSFFSTGNLVYLYIEDSSIGFTLPSTISSCKSKFKMFWAPISFYNALPSNLDTCVGLTDIYLNIKNDRSVAGYIDFNFPALKVFPYCNSMGIYFIYGSGATNIQNWTFPDALMNQPTVNFLEILDKGFTLPTSGQIDLSLYSNNLVFSLQRVGFFETCSKVCLKVPMSSSLQFVNLGLNMSNIDYTNVVSLSMNQNTLSQSLPVPATLKHSQVKLFSLTNSQFTGSIPTTNNFYCKFNATVLRLYGNQLTGSVPTCFSCVGANYAGSSSLLPNSFSDFTASSLPTTCPTLSFSTIPLVKTNQITVITLSGVDFGWDMQLVSPPVSPNNPSIALTIPNSQVVITIPKGDGTGKTITAKFGYNFRVSQIFTYSYEAPVLFTKYRYNGNFIILVGTGFSYTSNNLVLINSVSVAQQIATTNTENSAYGQLSVPTSSISASQGNTISVTITAGGQASPPVTLYYFKEISITLVPLYTIGGSVTLSGVFATTDKSMVSVKINGNSCTVQSITLSSISIIYPDSTVGDKEFIITFANNYEYKSTVTYVLPPKPTLFFKYSWKTVGSDKILVLYGTSFSTFTTNVATINNIDYVTSVATDSTLYPNYQEITLSNAIASLNSQNDGSAFVVSVKVGTQSSNPITFTKISQIDMNTKILLAIGGQIEFNGNYVVSSSNVAVSLSISNQPITGSINMSPTALSFSYPMNSPGSYNLVLNVGGFDYITIVTYVSVTPTLLNSYSYNSNNLIVISGTNFSYLSDNILVINGLESNVPAVKSDTGYDTIIIPATAMSTIPVGAQFSLFVKVVGQLSNSLNFYNIKPISMTTQQLKTNGGSVTFSNGVFSTSDKTITSLLINNIPCTINSTTPSTLSFYYPFIASPGVYNLNLKISGLSYSTTVTYVSSPVPTLLNRYTWSTLQGGEKTIVFYGNDFTYYNTMVATINGIGYTSTFGQVDQSGQYPGYDQISFTSSISGFESLNEGELFSVKVKVGLQSTNTVVFNFVRSISIQAQSLYNMGGIASFPGTFGVESSNNVTLLMDSNYSLQVLEITPTNIKFKYPEISNPGSYPLSLNIGGLDYSTTVNYILQPKPTLLNSYYWSNSDIIVFRGTWFNLVWPNNIVNINNQEYTPTLPLSFEEFEEITFSDNSPTMNLSEGDYFETFIKVGSQTSNFVKFIYIKSISITKEQLNPSGGTISFSGNFHTNDKAFVLLSIDRTNCTVVNINTTMITFSYPSKAKGEYAFLLNVGGFEYSTLIEYASTSSSQSTTTDSQTSSTGSQSTSSSQSTTTDSQTSSTGSQSTTATQTTTSSQSTTDSQTTTTTTTTTTQPSTTTPSSDESPSTSSKLSIPIISYLFVFSLFLFF